MAILIRLITFIAVLAVGGLAFILPADSLLDNPRSTQREIVLVAKNMSFMVEGDADKTANPTIALKPGEKLTILFRNDDQAMRHDLVIDGTDLRTKLLDYGQTSRITLTGDKGMRELIYLCTIHPQMMRGKIEVN